MAMWGGVCVWGGVSLSVRKAVKLKKTQLKVQNLCPLSYTPKPSSGPDWGLCQADTDPKALCFRHDFFFYLSRSVSLQLSSSSLSPDSLCVHWLTSEPCVAGETQPSRVSVPGEARLYTAAHHMTRASESMAPIVNMGLRITEYSWLFKNYWLHKFKKKSGFSFLKLSNCCLFNFFCFNFWTF